MPCIKTGARVYFKEYGCVCPADLFGVPGVVVVALPTGLEKCRSFDPEDIAKATHEVYLPSWAYWDKAKGMAVVPPNCCVEVGQ